MPPRAAPVQCRLDVAAAFAGLAQAVGVDGMTAPRLPGRIIGGARCRFARKLPDFGKN
jgi:hypothetical protein